jgi:hypothetical protein
MKRPTVGLDEIVHDLKSAFEVIRSELTAGYTRGISEQGEHALAHLETFAAISIRVMRQTNPSKLRDAARTEEIAARVQGREVLE